MKRTISLLLVFTFIASAAMFAACGGVPATSEAAPAPETASSVPEAATPETEEGGKENIRVAFLYDGPVNDGGWIQGHDAGRLAVEALPYAETTYIDNIPESNGWKYLNDFAKEEYDLVVACSFGYMNDCLEVAEQNPDTVFEHCAGYLTSENMGNYYGADQDATFLAGMAAGAVTESNIIGYVVPFPIPEVIRNINAFAEGAKLVNPDATIKLVWILTWYDPALEREGAESLINAGADVLSMYLNSPAVLQTAEKHGLYGCGSQSDMSSAAPEAHLMSTYWDWGVLYTHFAEEVYNGTWESEALWWGVPEGLVGITELSDKIPADARATITDYYDRLKAGDETALPFYAEIKDQTGTVRIPQGTNATLDELLSMDYLVDNVDGEIPAS